MREPRRKALHLAVADIATLAGLAEPPKARSRHRGPGRHAESSASWQDVVALAQPDRPCRRHLPPLPGSTGPPRRLPGPYRIGTASPRHPVPCRSSRASGSQGGFPRRIDRRQCRVGECVGREMTVRPGGHRADAPHLPGVSRLRNRPGSPRRVIVAHVALGMVSPPFGLHLFIGTTTFRVSNREVVNGGAPFHRPECSSSC